MEQDRIYQKNKEYELGKGTLKLNLYNGRMLYKYFVTSIGNGNFHIDVGVSYNWKVKEKKWKYSFEEWVKKYENSYNIEGCNVEDYIYTDKEWNIHRFVKYKENTYYDESGTGLRLEVKEAWLQIEDEYKNIRIYEKESGRLKKVVSGINDNIVKEIKYDEEGKVIEIYDLRKATQKIKFEYNENKLPIKISTTSSSIYYTLEYVENRLIKIYKNTKNNQKQIHEIRKDERERINWIINSENKAAININYLIKDGLEVVNKIIIGKIKKKLMVGKEAAEVYLGEGIKVGNSKYVTSTYSLKKGSVETMPKEYIKDIIKYEYEIGYTEETSQNGIKIRYYFDILGRMISNLEYKENFKYYTLEKEKGLKVELYGLSNIFFNGERVKEINKTNNTYSLNNINIDFGKIITRRDEYNVSFWMMTNKENDRLLVAKLKYKIEEEELEEQVIIHKTLGQVWQKINIPLIKKEIGEVKDIVITFEVDEENENDKLYITNVRVNTGLLSRINICNTKKGKDKEKIELKIGSKLYYYDTKENEVMISPSFYLSEKDIISTYKSIFESVSKHKGTYDLYYCDKTKVKEVGYVSMYPKTETIGNNEYYAFSFYEYDKKDNKKVTNEPNYRIRNILQTNYYKQFNNKYIKKVFALDTKINIYQVNNRYNYETIVKIGEVDKIDKEEVCRYSLESDDGLLIYQKELREVKDDESNLVKQSIVTKNNYDEYGNLISNVKYDELNYETEEIKIEYTYDETSPKKREKIKEIDDGRLVIKYEYNEEGRINSIINENNKEVYSYDEFGELIKISYLDSLDNVVNENRIKYNEEGNIVSLKDNNNNSYGFTYNAFSGLSEVYKNSKLVNRYQTLEDKANKIYNTYLYQGPKVLKNTIECDKYGNILSEDISNLKIEYSYENDDKVKSTFQQRIKEIKDPYTNQTYTYEYIEDSLGDTSVIENYNDIKIIVEENKSKRYDIQKDDTILVYKIEQDEKLRGLSCYKVNKEDNIEVAYDYNSYYYEYDYLDRLVKKKSGIDEYLDTRITTNKEIKYLDNTYLPNIINYKVIATSKATYETKESKLTYEIGYQNNKISLIKESGTRFKKNPKDETSLELINMKENKISYTYDDLNRLIEEEINENEFINYEYGKESGMIEKVYKDLKLTKEFIYELNKLTKVRINDIIYNIEYDNYGNTVKIGNTIVKYNLRNLMEEYKRENEVYKYEYNYQGIRSKKQKENEYTVFYYLDGTRIIGEDVEDINGNIIRKFRYLYDERGISGINYIKDGEEYLYHLIKDPLGNISKIMNKGRIIGEYRYDAFGNSTIKELEIENEIDREVLKNNPFRYKGYYLDIETKNYYCNNRYYSSLLYRWLTPDSIDYLDPESINGLNLYSL